MSNKRVGPALRIGIVAQRRINMRFASAIVVALLVATFAHAQASAKPQSCSWSLNGIPDTPPSPQRVIVAPSVAAAALMHRVEPDYSADAGIEGTVVLCAVIARDGTIQSLAYVSGPAPLIRAAIDAVKQWQYKRTLLDGKPIEVETKVFVEFTSKSFAKRKRSGSETDAAAATK